MMESRKTILFWGHDLFHSDAFLNLIATEFPEHQILLRDQHFRIEDSLMSPPDLCVIELDDNAEPLERMQSIWPQTGVVLIAQEGSEDLMADLLKRPVVQTLVADREGRFLTLVSPIIRHALVLSGPRFSMQPESRAHALALESKPDTSYDLDPKRLYSLLRTMTDTVPDMIWAKDLEGKYIYTNTSTCDQLLNANNTLEPIGRNHTFFAQRERDNHPEDRDWYTFGSEGPDTDAQTLKAGQLKRYKEAGYISGNYLIFDVYKAPLYDEAGELVGTVGTARDITLHEETKERYRKLFEYSPDPVVVHIDGIAIAANQAAADFIGAENIEDHLGSNVYDFVHPESVSPQVSGEDPSVLSGSASQPIHSKYITLDGQTRDVETVSVPIKYANQNAWMVTFRDITERKLAEEQIKSSLLEKEALLQEIYHRTKNNMQVISAIINIRSRDLKDPQAAQMFTEIRDRIAAMSLAHDRLYAAKDLSAIDFKPYLELLSTHLRQSYAQTAQRAPIKILAENVIVSIDQAVPLGLVINEILTNAYKYAFPEDQTGQVMLEMRRGDTGQIYLKITDDGIGLPVEAFNDSLSTVIITGLVEDQLNGSISYNGLNGTEFVIQIPYNEVARRI